MRLPGTPEAIATFDPPGYEQAFDPNGTSQATTHWYTTTGWVTLDEAHVFATDVTQGSSDLLLSHNCVGPDVDRGSLKITKTTINPDGATLPAAFTGSYDCGIGYAGSFSVANLASQTFSGIPTGSICSVTEIAPAATPGFTWGPITYTPASVVIGQKDTTFEIVVGNSITADAPWAEGGGAGVGGGPEDKGGGGGAADQPPTDTFIVTDSLSAVGGSLDTTISWALWVLLTATTMVSGALVIRRQRASDI